MKSAVESIKVMFEIQSAQTMAERKSQASKEWARKMAYRQCMTRKRQVSRYQKMKRRKINMWKEKIKESHL